MDTAHDENMNSTSFWDKATEIYYSLLVARFVYFHSYLIERKRPTQMILFSNIK